MAISVLIAFLASAQAAPAASLRVAPEFQYQALSPHDAYAAVKLSQVPSNGAVRAAYPRASRATTSVVALDCTVVHGGALADCKVKLADPKDAQPKAAALKLSRAFKVDSAFRPATIRLFIQFSGRVDRCLQPFCFADLPKPPPLPPRHS